MNLQNRIILSEVVKNEIMNEMEVGCKTFFIPNFITKTVVSSSGSSKRSKDDPNMILSNDSSSDIPAQMK